MKFSASEIGVINYSLNTTGEVSPDGRNVMRQFPLSSLEKALKIRKKIMNKTKDSENGKVFINADIEFSTEEKTLILSLLNRSWSVDDAEKVLSLKTKLS